MFARALPDDGIIYSLEFNENHATVARENIKNAGFSHCTKVIVGAATDSMKQLITDQIEPFDLIFIDADKQNNPHYLELSLKLSKPDRKSTRLNSSHVAISYAVFCLKKKTKTHKNKSI